jgi:hypothetical protein
MKRRHSATAAAAMPSIIEVYAKAISRKRERLTFATEYTHANLVAYLNNEVLPAGWVVHAPSSGATGISQFPVAHVNRAKHAKELAHLADFLCGIPVSEAEDQYNGHCETCAVYFTNEVVKLIESEVKLQPSGVLNEAYVLLNKKLAVLAWEDCVAEMFGAERRAREDKELVQGKQKGRTAAMWESLSTRAMFADVSSVCVSGEGAHSCEDTAGVARAIDFIAGSPGLPSRILSSCGAVVASNRTIVVPLYVLNCACFHRHHCHAPLSLSLSLSLSLTLSLHPTTTP